MNKDKPKCSFCGSESCPGALNSGFSCPLNISNPSNPISPLNPIWNT